MQDLRLVGVHDDGEHLVLSTPDGHKYLLLVDDPLRAAIRLDRARLSQLQIEGENRLRPRDIQARIRAGQTAEEIAESAGVPVELVRRFEGPVLAEREFVVRQAQAVRVRHAKGGSTTLGEIVTERLAARDVEDDAQTWDAWRDDDGVWMVSLSFEAGGRRRQARWSYDAQLRHVTPQDDESRWLTEDEPHDPGTRHPRLTTVGGTTARRDGLGDMSPGRDRVYDIEADPGARPAVMGNATVDLLDSLRERRGRRQRVADPEYATGPAGIDPLDAALRGTTPPRSPGREPPAGHTLPPLPEPEAEVVVLTDTEVMAPLPPSEPAAPPVEDEPDPVPATPDPPSTERPPSRRARRASVPKWDDIVFGSRRE
jgi:hypothetical protein